MTSEQFELKHKYLKKHIFYGLSNLNNGFDVESIYYFNELEFEIVLERVKALHSIGVYGIEPHRLNKETGQMEYYSCLTHESYFTYPQNSAWYFHAFADFKAQCNELLYSASFYVPTSYLESN